MPEAVIVDAVRTPIGRAVKGSLKDVRADDLAAVPLKALVERNPEVDFAQTDDLMMGCGFQAGEQGYNIGRNAGLLAGIDHHVPATTVNRFCASSLQTIRMAFHAIVAGEGDQYIAAGVEAVSRFGADNFQFHPQLDGSEGAPYNVYIPMGLTAENVAERCNVSRESQDEWAAISQQRAVAARDSGHFDREIVAVQHARRRGHQGRRPAPRHDGREARRAQAGVQARRHRHRRQRLPAERRRRRRARHVRREGREARAQAARPHHRLRRRRPSAPRSWASARSRRSRRCSSRPA